MPAYSVAHRSYSSSHSLSARHTSGAPSARCADMSSSSTRSCKIAANRWSRVGPDTEHSPDYPAHLFSDPRAKLVAPALRASYALVGSQARPGEHGPLTGIHIILSNGGDDTGRQHREAQVLQTGLFYSAARFRIIEGSPEPAEWLEVFETDARDPLDTFAQAPSDTPSVPAIEPVLSESFRLVGTSKTGTA
jgi:hypothetical protein